MWNENIQYFKKLQLFKRVFQPLIYVLDSTRLLPFLVPVLNWTMRKFKIKRQLQKDLNYRLIAKAVKGRLNKEPKKEEKIILIPFFTGGDNIFLLINMLITYRLQKKGYRGIFIICDKTLPVCTNERVLKTRTEDPYLCKNCYRPYDLYAKVIGAEFWKLSDFIDQKLASEKEHEIKAFNSIDECKEFKIDGVAVGLIAEKSVMRFFLTGELNDSDEHLEIYKRFLLSLAFIANAWANIISKIDQKPSLVLLYNGTLSFETYIRKHCESDTINYVTHETYVGQNSWIYKKNDEVMKLKWANEWSEFKKTPLNKEQLNQAKDFLEGLRHGKEMYAKLNEPTPIEKMIDGEGEFAVLFTNLNFDTAVLGRNPLFASMSDWIENVIDYWIEHETSLKLIIRVHPGEIKLVTPSSDFIGPKIRKRIKGHSNIILFDAIDKVDSYTLIENMKFGLIYSSTIGLEISYMNKVCMIAGDAFYKNEAFVIAPKTLSEYFGQLKGLIKNPSIENKTSRLEILHFIFFIYFHRVKRLNGISMDHSNHVNLFSFETIEELDQMNKETFEEFEKEISI